MPGTPNSNARSSAARLEEHNNQNVRAMAFQNGCRHAVLSSSQHQDGRVLHTVRPSCINTEQRGRPVAALPIADLHPSIIASMSYKLWTYHKVIEMTIRHEQTHSPLLL